MGGGSVLAAEGALDDDGLPTDCAGMCDDVNVDCSSSRAVLAAMSAVVTHLVDESIDTERCCWSCLLSSLVFASVQQLLHSVH